jgi:archaellum biogenesis ATPase FlaH
MSSVHRHDDAKTKLQTGIRKIDRELDGGIEQGSLLSVIAGPATQSEALFQQLIGERPTLYLTTLREPESVEKRLGTDSEEVFVKDVRGSQTMDKEFLKQITGTRSYSLSIDETDDILDAVYETIERVDREMNVILDPINPLEETDQPGAYREVINKFQSKMLETGGVGVLHCVTLEDAPPLRDVTLAISDVVFELDLVQLTNEMQYQLTIPKNRGGTPLLEETAVKFDSEVWIDDTRNI